MSTAERPPSPLLSSRTARATSLSPKSTPKTSAATPAEEEDFEEPFVPEEEEEIPPQTQSATSSRRSPIIPPATEVPVKSPPRRVGESPAKSASVARRPSGVSVAAAEAPVSEQQKARTRRRSLGEDEREMGRHKLIKRLMAFGYQPKKWIFVTDDEDREALAYVLADIFGDLVFIELDSNISRVSSLDDDLKVRKTLEATMASAHENLKDVDISHCGAMCWSASGLCSKERKHDDSLDVEHRQFVLSSKPAEVSMRLDNSSIIYPVVRLSQIEKNNIATMKTIKISTQKFRLAAIATMEARKMTLIVAIGRLHHAAHVVAGAEGIMTAARNNLLVYFRNVETQKCSFSYPPAVEQQVAFERTMTYSTQCTKAFEGLVMRSAHLARIEDDICKIIDELQEILTDTKNECQ